MNSKKQSNSRSRRKQRSQNKLENGETTIPKHNGGARRKQSAVTKKVVIRARNRDVLGSISQGSPGTRSVVANDKLFEQLASKRGVKKSSIDFLKGYLDPFHDTSFVPRGFPDRATNPTVVERFPVSCSPQYPTGNTNFPVGGTWDLHIIFNPWSPTPMIERERVNNQLLGIHNTGHAQLIGGVQCYAVQPNLDMSYTGNDFTILNPPIVNVTGGNIAGATSVTNTSLWIKPETERGLTRIVGVGLEVIDNTAQLADQGMITCWRANEPQLSPSTYGTSSAAASAMTGQVYRYPPTNLGEALLYPSSSQWKAREGTYMPGIMATFENPLLLADYSCPFLIEADDADDVPSSLPQSGYANVTNLWVPQDYAISDINPTRIINCQKLYPFQQMGCVLSSLPSTASITVRLIAYVEYAPSSNDPRILSFARMASPYDPIALEFLARVNRQLAVAFPADANADGDVWASIVEILGIFVGAAITPFAPMLGPAVIAGGVAVGSAMRGGGK